MKIIYAIFLTLCAGMPLHSTAANAGDPNEAQLSSHDHYKNKSGQIVHSPAKSKTGKAPANATAQCRDNSYSFSQHHRGTCSGHGGVAQWMQ